MFFLILEPLIIILFVGLLVLSAFNILQKTHILNKLGFAYGIGIGCLTIEMMLFSFFHIAWNILFIVLPWVIIFLLLLFAKKLTYPKLQFNFNLSIVETCLLLSIIITIGYVIFEALLRPLMAFDAWVNWFLAGKAFYLSGAIDPKYVLYSSNSNPPLINILVAFIYETIRTTNEQVAMLFFTFFYMALLSVFYFSARNYMSRKNALLFTFFLTTLENVIRHAGRFDVGYADLPLGYFIFCTTLLLVDFINKKSVKLFIIFTLFASTAALVKSEGLPFFLIITSIACISIIFTNKNRMKYITILFMSFLLIFSWSIVSKLSNLPQNPITFSTVKINRIPIILFYYCQEFLYVTRWNFLWIAFILCLFSLKTNKMTKMLGLLCLSILGVYFIVYLMTPVPVLERLRGSFDRLLLQITPLAMLFISIIFSEYFKEFKNKKKKEISI